MTLLLLASISTGTFDFRSLSTADLLTAELRDNWLRPKPELAGLFVFVIFDAFRDLLLVLLVDGLLAGLAVFFAVEAAVRVPFVFFVFAVSF